MSTPNAIRNNALIALGNKIIDAANDAGSDKGGVERLRAARVAQRLAAAFRDLAESSVN